MVTLYLSHTAPINPSGITPVLTIRQIWAGLQRKVRFAQEFVPIIESCTVLEEQPDGTVVRDVVFKEGGPKPKARETVKEYYPSWVDFEQEDGTHVRNVISDGSDGGLYMTYMFEFKMDHLEEGSEKVESERLRLKGMAKGAVGSSIEAIREMVRDGRIKN